MVQHVRAHERRGREHLGYTAPPVQVRAYERRSPYSNPGIYGGPKRQETIVGPLYEFRGYQVTGKLKESGVPFPNDELGDTLHNRFKVTVKSPGGNSTSFDLYGSDNDFRQGRTELGPDELQDAFMNFADEALSGYYSFEDWVGEYGYDEDSRKAERIYKAIQRETEKAARIGLDTEDRLVEMVNALREDEEDRRGI